MVRGVMRGQGAEKPAAVCDRQTACPLRARCVPDRPVNAG